MTAPFAAKAAALLASSLRHESSVTVHPAAGEPFALDVSGDLSVTFAEDWSPYVQASLSAAVPAEQAKLDALDPRELCRIRINAGYTYPDNETQIFPLADLGLKSRGVNRPANTLALSAESDEAIAQDYTWTADAGLDMPTTGINEAVDWCLSWPFMQIGYSLSSAFGNGTAAADLADLKITAGNTMWKMLDEIAARTGHRVYCDEAGIWQIRPRPLLATHEDASGTVAHFLTIGENGTLTDTATTLSRDNWYNSVFFENTWPDPAGGSPFRIFGVKTINVGPASVGAVGYRTYYEKSDRPISQDTANKRAAAKLANLASRGRSLQLTAIAAYWLRPGMTISVTLPTGDPERYLIQSITFHPLSGLMDITTRQPLDTEISTGE